MERRSCLNNRPTELTKRPLLIVLATTLMIGCGVTDADKNQPISAVYVLSPAGGTFTALQRNALGAGGGSNVTFQGNGSFQEVIRIGSNGNRDTSLQEVRGTFTGAYLVVGFGMSTIGGIVPPVGAESGSLRSGEGPHQQTLSCQVRYDASQPGGSTYRVSFRWTGDRTKLCESP